MSGLCTPLSPSQQEHARPRGLRGTGTCRENAPPREKPAAEHAMPLRRRLFRERNAPPPEARGRRGSAGKNSGIQVAETFLCPESRKTSRGSPTAQGKNWLWKRKLTRCAGSPHDTGTKKRPAPVSHGRSEGDFPNFRVTPRQGERRSPAECSRKNIQIPGTLPHAENTAGRMFLQKVSPLRTSQEKENFHRGAVPALLFAASLSARACARTTESQRPRPAHKWKHSGRTDAQETGPPFPHRETCSARL